MNTDQLQAAAQAMGLTNLNFNPKPRTLAVKNIGQIGARYAQPNQLRIYVGRWGQNQLPADMICLRELGNPHVLAPYRCGICDKIHDRRETIDLFTKDLKTNRYMQKAGWELATLIVSDKRERPVELLCHCAPLLCHADVIANRLIQHLTFLKRI